MLRFPKRLAGILAAIALMLPTAAAAQMACGSHAEIVAGFAENYREVPRAFGITDRGALIEVLVAPSGSWTMLLTMPGGLACVIGTGRDWQLLPAALAEETA